MGRFSRVGFLIVGLLFVPAVLFAQFNNSTSSPYSRYGLGDLHSYAFGRAASMGGATLASRYNLQINSANPASYTAMDSLNFLFEFGIEGTIANFETEISSAKSNDVNFNYLAMSFRISNKVATSLGLQPYSDVGYGVVVNDNIENIGDIYSNYYGTGTISKAFIGIAYEPIKNVSFGMNFNYMFGQLNHNSEVTFSNPAFYNVQRYSEIRIRDFGLDFGLQATLPLKNDKEITFAAVFANRPVYTDFANDKVQKTLQFYNGQTTVTDVDTLHFQEEEKGELQFPYTFGGGISFRKKNVYEINLDYYYQNWSEATFLGETSNFLADLNKFAIGGEWIPNIYSIRSVLNRMAYRAGLKYEQSYHSFDGHQVNDFGISFGVGIPIYRSASTINLGAEFGRRGTTENNLVLEKYTKIYLSMNLRDLWFQQRKID